VEEKPEYIVDITPEGEIYYFQLLEYLYNTHSLKNADRKSEEIMEMALSLAKNPYRGRIEEKLRFLKKEHRFLIYSYTTRKTIKIIYFIDEKLKKVYITDFFPTEKDDATISGRHQ